MPIQVPKTRDRSGTSIHFTSNVLPPYLRRSRSVEELLPWLYLKGVSTGDFQEALTALLGEQAEGLSASTLGRLKQQWLVEHDDWRERDLSTRRYIDWWADGIHFNLRGGDDDRACLLVIIGVLPDGTKEFVTIDDGVRESTQSGYELLIRLRDTQGLTSAPRLAIGDGALGFWKALEQAWPGTRGQRYWVHKTANVLNRLPKSSQAKAKSAAAGDLDGEEPGEGGTGVRGLRDGLGRQIPEGRRTPGKGPRGAAGVLRLPGQPLAVDPDHEPDRVDVRHRASSNRQDPRLCHAQHDPEPGVQARPERAKTLAPPARLSVAR